MPTRKVGVLAIGAEARPWPSKKKSLVPSRENTGPWRVAAAIAAVMFAAVSAAGFRGYLHDEVSVVLLSCRTSTKGARLRYVLRMLDGNDVDFVRVPARRIAPAPERMASRLDSVPNVTYILDVTEPAVVAFGRDHGTRFADEIRAQVQERRKRTSLGPLTTVVPPRRRPKLLLRCYSAKIALTSPAMDSTDPHA